jgi:hypothetical protein
MTISIAQFRLNYPEFGDITKLPDAMIQTQLNIAYLLLTERWDSTIIDYGAELFAAHMIVLSMQDLRTVEIGGIPGTGGGIIASKSVGGVALSYDTAGSLLADWDFWNLSTYGKRFASIARIIGMGGLQMGIGSPAGIPTGVLFGGGNILGED